VHPLTLHLPAPTSVRTNVQNKHILKKDTKIANTRDRRSCASSPASSWRRCPSCRTTRRSKTSPSCRTSRWVHLTIAASRRTSPLLPQGAPRHCCLKAHLATAASRRTSPLLPQGAPRHCCLKAHLTTAASRRTSPLLCQAGPRAPARAPPAPMLAALPWPLRCSLLSSPELSNLRSQLPALDPHAPMLAAKTLL